MRRRDPRSVHVTLALCGAFLISVSLGAVEAVVGENTRQVEHRIEARQGARISIRQPVGQLRVIGWDRPEMTVTGTVDEGVEDVRLETDQQRIWLEVVLAGTPGEQQGVAELEVRLPLGSAVEVHGVETSAVLKDLEHTLNIESVTGTLQIEGGSLREAKVSTVTGDISIEGPILRLQARTVTGRVRVEAPVDDLLVRTSGGDIEMFSPVIDEARLESVSGRIHVASTVAETGRLRVFVHEGRADLELPRDLAAEFQVETSSGIVESAFGPAFPSPETPGRRVSRFRTGESAARIEVRSLRGAVSLEAKDF